MSRSLCSNLNALSVRSLHWKEPLFALSVIFLLSACAEDDLPKYSDLGGLRILALQAGSDGGAAEFSPGDAVTITPWISDFKGGTRTLTYTAAACIDPGIALGVQPSCRGVPGAVDLPGGAATVPATERTGATTQISVTIPPPILTGRSARDQFNGVSYLVTYELVASDGTKATSFKRLLVSSSGKTSKNTNPTLSSAVANGVPLTALPTSETEISSSYPAGSVETYNVQLADGSQRTETEELLTTWFVSTGELELFRTIGTQATKFKPTTATPDHSPVIVGVIRDGRGGVSVKTHLLTF